MLKLLLWLRYLGKRRVVLLSIAAVALSCALLIVVASLFNGFINAFEQSAVDAIGDVVIAPPARFAKYPELIERLEQTSAVEAATATLTAKGLLHLGKGNVRGVDIWGIEPERRDIAILKSCGAGSGAVAFIFLGFGVFVGALGTLLGTVLGYLVTKNINVVEGWIRVVFGLKLWKSSVYMFSKIPNEVDWQAAVWIVLSAIAGAAIGALIPAVSAAITRPVNVLRYE